MDEKTEFVVGGRYENVKGAYEVISITGDSMVIRWDNGEEISSSIELQERIIENMKFREQLTQNQNTPKPVNKIHRSSGSQFSGLKNSDFKNNVVKTKWRNRNGLGGAVAKQLYSREFNFQSWAVYRVPTVHWAGTKHRKKTEINKQAKFYVQLDENCMQYGFCVEGSNGSIDKQEDWNAFLSWLKSNENWLSKIAQENNLSVQVTELDGDTKVSEKVIEPDNGEWISSDKIKISSLSFYLNGLKHSHWIQFYLALRTDKENVIAKNDTVAGDIAAIFQILMPVYTASAVRH